MRTVQTITELRNALLPLRLSGKQIGFVPTMGALHDGHMSLVSLAKRKTDVTVVSIFVNPSQFGPSEDFAKYPRTLDEDVSKLIDAEVDFLFVPPVSEIYPEGHSTTVSVGQVTDTFEGAIRPGHFQGVSTVVAALFHVVQPHIAFFGQKDAQQVAVIKRMVRDLHFPLEIQVGETVRESGKLALSSRNRYLSTGDRKESEALSTALLRTKEAFIVSSDIYRAKQAGIEIFQRLAPHGKLDYLDIVDSETFQSLTSFDAATSRPEEPPTIIIAARFGETRLIDNMIV